MAGVEFVTAVFLRHKSSLLRELCDSNVLSILTKKGIVTTEDEDYISNIPDVEKKCEFFIEIIAKQSLSTFSDFCRVIEKECPTFVNEILNDQCLPSSHGVNLLETLKESMVLECNINRDSSPGCRRSLSRGGSSTPLANSRRCSMSPETIPISLNHTIELYTEPVVEDDDRGSGAGGSAPAGGGIGAWETHRVAVSRIPGYGFGIAVSGGRDNPHFASGDPSIAVSDVLKAGPAEELLQVNDRIISVNGVSLENVEYATAVGVLRDSGNTVSLVVRRRAPHAPPLPAPPTPLKITLTKASKKEDFGIVLGCKLFIKELSPKARDQLTSAGQSLCEGDVITRINSTPCGDTMSLKEARKIMESCKERLSLVVLREQRPAANNSSGLQEPSYNNNYGSEPLNSYSGQNLYVAPPSRSTLLADERMEAVGGRSRGPLPPSASPPHLDHLHPPRPPPPRPEDYYSSRRQLYEEDPLSQRNKPASEPRLISFQKDGSVGLRLTGGNQVGIFVSAVQPGSPASLQGLTPGDNILKINEMEMKGVTREEAVLFLLSLQEQIDLIVQHSPEEYQAIAAQQKGDSFHIKCHFHYTEPTKGEMSFRSGDVFHVVDTLHNGTVGAWQVFRIGRNNQEVQKGIIPNKARAEELATAQFNATKKELSASSSESRGSFFRRRRSTHRRSKSLGKEHWDDMVFSDSISKFPAYERVVLKHPGFVRPVVLFGPIADLAREKLLRDYPDKFTAPQLDNTMEDGKSKSTSGIIRLSGIRSIMDRGKHALLDITPNAVDRLNYAQFYPIVIFLKADNKHIIKQLRHSMPKSAHKSSKKLLEHCQRMDRVWGHIFTQTIGLNEPTANSWYTKLTELIQRSQAQQLWISETKRSEPLSDDFLFPMSTTNESRLSYASSPESDVEAGGPEGRAPPRMLRASSDPSVATQQDALDRDEMGGADVAPPPPPYTTGYGDSKYGFSSNGGSGTPLADGAPGAGSMGPQAEGDVGPYSPPRAPLPMSPPQSPQGMYGHVPELPPRIDRGVKPPGGVLLPGPTPGRNPPTLRHHQPNNTRPSAQERLFGTPRSTEAEAGSGGAAGAVPGTGAPGDRTNTTAQGSLDRHRHLNNTYSYDSMSSYDSYGPTGAAPTTLALANSRLGPNAPDDLKVGPRTDSNTYEAKPIGSPQQRHSTGPVPEATSPSTYGGQFGGRSGPNDQYGTRPDQYGSRTEQFPGRMEQFVTNGGRTEQPSARMEQFAGNGSRTELYGAPPGPYGRGGPPSQSRPHHMSSGDYSKYSSNRNSTEYVGGSVGKAGGAGLYKPVPPPKPKHYRPPPAAGSADPPPPAPQHSKSYSVGNGSMEIHAMHGAQPGGPQNGWGGSPGRAPPGGWPHPQQAQHAHSLSYHPHQQSMYGGQPPPQAPPYTGPPPHTRGPPHANSSHVIDLAGSREQRGSAFELYRKPQHNISPALAMMESGGNETDTSPKVNKKLSKKSSFLRSITIDLFRLKSKKVAKHHSVCENDFHDKPKSVELRREKSDVGNAPINSANKSRGLFRSNSSCENTTHLNSILKRQSSFSDNRLIPPIRDSITIPAANLHLRRQNSMCEIETEPRIKPILRRQNSLLEYNRHGIHDYQFKPFNMIRAIDPLYQHKAEIKHEPFYPGKDVRSFREPIFQTKNEAVYGAVPKPERTYAARSKVKTASPYASREEVIKNQTQCPYSSRQEVINEQTLRCRSDQGLYSSKQELCHKTYESPNSLRCEIEKENTYESRLDCNQQRSRDSPSGMINHSSIESPYTSKSEIMRQRSSRQNPYSTKEEMLRQRLGIENPYGTKDGLKERVSWECPHAAKGELIKQGSAESSYATKEDVIRYRGIENPYQTKEELLRQRLCSENPYGTKEQFIQKTCSENTCNELDEIAHYRDPVENSNSKSVEFRKHRRCSESSYSSRDENNHFRPHSDNMSSTREACARSQSNSCYDTQQKNVIQSLLDNNFNDSVGSEHAEFSYVNNLATLRIGDNPHITVAELNKRSSAELHVKPLNDGECSLSNVTTVSDQGPCVCEDVSSRIHRAHSPRTSSAESPYVTKQEILSQKAALLANKEIQNLHPEDRFEIIKLRNQAKKEKIYQSRIEAMKEGNSADPVYISKRDLKESVIYESQSEIKDQLMVKKDSDLRHSPYDLSDVAHLSRRESLYQSKQEAMQQSCCSPRHPGVDFEALRNQSQTDQEKQSNLIYETKILKGEPMYQSRLPPKVKFVSQDIKQNKATAFNSATSMETHYESECSMQFDSKPQSTPYTSQDIDRGNETIPTFKCNNKSVKFANSSGEGHDTTIVPGPLVLDTDLLAVGQKGKIGSADGPCTTWGIFDSEGGVLEDRSWGVSLLIPPDAILPGVKQKIYFTVSDPTHNQTTPGPPIDMDKGEALLSPLVMCGPQGLGFARPVTLRLPHCANTLPSLGLTLNATDTEPGPSPSWDNILLPATTTLNTVAVKVDHF